MAYCLKNEKRCLKYLRANNADQMRGLLSCSLASASSRRPLNPPSTPLLQMLYMIIHRLEEGEEEKVRGGLGGGGGKGEERARGRKTKEEEAARAH